MKLRISRILVILGCSALFMPPASAFNIASFGEARAVIVTGPNPSPVVQEMARELTNYLDRIVVGAKFKISERPVGGKNTIRLGTPYAGKPDEFAVFVNKRSELELTGTPPRGTVYAAYALLEQLGCRFWAPDQETVPTARQLVLPSAFKLVEAPAFAPRPVWCEDGAYPYWLAKNRLTSGIGNPIPEKLGGSSNWNMGETLALKYVAPKTYFKAHPDWYALRPLKAGAPGPGQIAVTEGATPGTQLAGSKGKHAEPLVRDSSQICSTNPEVIQKVIEEVRAELAKHPDAETLALGFNDNDCYCRCRRCLELAARGGSRNSARCVALANEVAKAIAHDYPKTKIVPLAYWVTEVPPDGMKCEPNVRVALAHGMYREGLGLLEKDALQMSNLRTWLRISPGGLYIWGYYANFANFLYPNQDLFDMGPNFRLYKRLGVLGVSCQLPLGALADFVDFRCWLYAKLLWNPDQDEHKLFEEWAAGTCGKGAPMIRAYMDLREKVRADKKRIGFKQGADLVRAYDLVEKALAATEGDEAAHRRVEKISAGLLAAVISGYGHGVPAAAKAQGVTVPPRAALLDRFEALAAKYRQVDYAGEHRSFPEWIKIMRSQP